MAAAFSGGDRNRRLARRRRESRRLSPLILTTTAMLAHLLLPLAGSAAAPLATTALVLPRRPAGGATATAMRSRRPTASADAASAAAAAAFGECRRSTERRRRGIGTHRSVGGDALDIRVASQRTKGGRNWSLDARTAGAETSAVAACYLSSSSGVDAARSPLFSNACNNSAHCQQRRRRRHPEHSMIMLPLVFQTLRRLLLTPIPALASSSPSSSAAVVAHSSPAIRSISAALSTVPARLTEAFSILRTKPRDAIRPLLLVASVLFALLKCIDVVSTRRRQASDATSEWGRYADDPSARGGALLFLCLRIVPYLLLARILKLLPGGGGGDDGGAAVEEKEDADQAIRRRRWSPRQTSSRLRTKSGNLFADGLLRLGPLYIKIGQILSCRENLLPEEWSEPMEKLQDRVPAKSGREALDLVYEAMPGGKQRFDEVFVDFDDVPLAAASLGQVHRAKLRGTGNGKGADATTATTIAIKVQRARLRDIYDKDLALMHKIATAVDRFAGKVGNVGGVKQSWDDIFTDAEVILYREIDYRDEAENAVRFANDFGLGLDGKATQCTAKSTDGKPLPSASSWLRTPYVYEGLSSEKILVMEYVPSIKISDTAKLDEAGVMAEDREYLSESLARSYLRQFCADKFFSTDPHPGNLGVEVVDGGRSPPRLVFYDFGQACSLADDQAGGILDVIEGIVDMNAGVCVSAFDRMGVLVDGADLDKVERKVQNNFDTGKVKVKKKKAKLKKRRRMSSNAKRRTMEYDNDEKEGSAVVQEGAANKVAVGTDIAFSIGQNATSERSISTDANNNSTTSVDADVTKQNATSAKSKGDDSDPEVMEFFTLPAEYAFVARAISQMDGVGKGLDPEFDFISACAPYLVEVKGATNYLKDEARKYVGEIERRGMDWQARLLSAAGWNASTYLKKDTTGGGVSSSTDAAADGDGE